MVARQPSALAGAAEFGFRHVLIRDVAYDSLPKRDRAAKHLDVARWAEEALPTDRTRWSSCWRPTTWLRCATRRTSRRPTRSACATSGTRRTPTPAGRAAERMPSPTRSTRPAGCAWPSSRRASSTCRARERAALAVDYSEAAGGHEPNEAIRSALEEALALMTALPDRAAADEQQIAQVRIHLAFYVYSADELDAARGIVQAGIDALASGPPTPGLAGLRARLGWTYWRAGPLEEAPPILRRAIDEARACEAEDVERMALHDLAIATGMLGDMRNSVALVERSLELARATNDRGLLGRCYINVTAIRNSNGETSVRIMPLAIEGLDRARRGLDHGLASWIAQNVADLLSFEGRLADAIDYANEGVVHAERTGDRARLAACLAQRAFIRLERGDRDGWRADVLASRRLWDTPEPQAVIYDAMFDALVAWTDDPIGASGAFARALGSPECSAAVAGGFGAHRRPHGAPDARPGGPGQCHRRVRRGRRAVQRSAPGDPAAMARGAGRGGWHGVACAASRGGRVRSHRVPAPSRLPCRRSPHRRAGRHRSGLRPRRGSAPLCCLRRSPCSAGCPRSPGSAPPGRPTGRIRAEPAIEPLSVRPPTLQPTTKPTSSSRPSPWRR